MYKSVVILVSNYRKNVDLDEILSKVRAYVGIRLIEEEELDEGAPMVPLTSTLTDVDKKAISDMCGNDTAPVFLEYHEDEEDLMGNTYITARIKR